jgi:signal transduction histidine kinase
MTAAELTLKAKGERLRLSLVCALLAPLLAAVLVRPPWLMANGAQMRAGVETIAGMAVLAGAIAALLRARRTRATSDLALAIAIWLAALTSLLLAALTLEPAISTSTVEWLAVPMRVGSGGLLLAAGRPAIGARRLPGLPALVLLVIGVTAALSLIGLLLGSLTSAGVPDRLQLATAVLYLAGALTVWRRAQRLQSSALKWFAAGAASLSLTRVTFTLFGTPVGHWLSPGDAMRLVTGMLLLMAVRAEVLARAKETLETRIEQERHRLAREIHDGMAQELAFIVSQSRRLIGRGADVTTLELLAQAGQNALADARRTIYDLKRTPTKAFSAAIVERAWQMTARAGLELDVEVEGEASVGAEAQHVVLRVVEEAVSNVARHGQASSVSIKIRTSEQRLIVRIADNGCGFDPRDSRRRRGFGLTSMTQRMESLGGRLRLESAPGQGTMVEAMV